MNLAVQPSIVGFASMGVTRSHSALPNLRFARVLGRKSVGGAGHSPLMDLASNNIMDHFVYKTAHTQADAVRMQAITIFRITC